MINNGKIFLFSVVFIFFLAKIIIDEPKGKLINLIIKFFIKKNKYPIRFQNLPTGATSEF